MQLEGVLEERLAQLSLLAQENAALKRREAALQSAVSSLAGSVSAATRAVLVSSAGDDAPGAMRAALRPCSPYSCSIADHKSFLRHMQQREAAVQVRGLRPSTTCRTARGSSPGWAVLVRTTGSWTLQHAAPATPLSLVPA
jgi:hypothetical protein